MMWLIWLLVALVAFSGEALTTALILASFGAAALIAAPLSLVTPIWAQVVLFSLMALVLLLVVRPAALRVLPIQDRENGAPSMGPVGKQGTAVTSISPKGGEIRIGSGEFWSARPFGPGITIPAGADVEVVEMDGLTARVRTVADDQYAAGTLPDANPAASTNPFGLSDREVEVLQLVSLGLSNQEIADRLVLSPRTVHHHVSHILTKMDAQSRVEAVRLGLDQGLIQPRG